MVSSAAVVFVRLLQIELAFEDAAGAGVERDPVAGLEVLASDLGGAGFLVDFHCLGSGDAALAHAARDDGGVAGGASASGQEPG